MAWTSRKNRNSATGRLLKKKQMDKVLLFGENESNSLAIQVMKEKYGEDIQVVTIDEANEMGLTPEDFRNIPRYEITRPNRMLSDQIPFIESKRVGKGGRAKNRSRYGRK
jgi:hypothetical protein